MDRTSKHSNRDEKIEKMTVFIQKLQRKKSVMLLFAGAICGFLGFAFAFVIGTWKFLNPVLEGHRTFPSGRGYFPATVSEMVHDPKEPAGKVFFAFEFIGALFIFMSWYPWYLGTVFVGDDAKILDIPVVNWISWPTFRQFIPPVGMMLVATVTTTPFAKANELDYICIAWHLTGAVMLFGGYAVAEAHCVGFGPMHQSRITAPVVVGAERWWRQFWLAGIVLWYAIFCVLTVVCVLPLPGQSDVWVTFNNTTSADGFPDPRIVLVDTANGFILFLKIFSYLSEVLCGVSLILNMLTIWYFSEERHLDLNDKLLHLVTKFEKKQNQDRGVATGSQFRC